jgi:hypothetical protein
MRARALNGFGTYIGSAAAGGWLLACPSFAQTPDAPVLDIPDSLVIQGKAQVELILSGTKDNTYYDRAFPVEREETPEELTSVTAMPATPAKETFPLFVRHGSTHATAFQAAAQHFGNASLWAGRWQDWQSVLISSDAEIGGGKGHVEKADWWRTAASVNARYPASWRTAWESSVSGEAGRTSVWDPTLPSRRDYTRGEMRFGFDRAFGSDQEVRIDVNSDARRVAGPEATATEQTLLARVGWQNTTGRFWVSANMIGSFLHNSRPMGMSGNSSFYVVSGEAWTRPEENFGGAIGVSIYTVNHLAGDSLRTIRPSITAWARIKDFVKFSGRLTSGVDELGIWEAYRANPMLNLATPLRTPFRSVDIDLNAEIPIHRDNIWTFGFRQLLIQNYPVWVRKDTAATWSRRFAAEPYVANQFAIDYAYAGTDLASITAFYARYRYSWRVGSVDALGVLRAHSLVQQAVPYVPDWEFHVSSNLPYRRLTISPAIHAFGPRHYIDSKTVDTIAELRAYALANLEISTPLRRGWLLTLSGSNLLNSSFETWNGFKEPGVFGQIGVRRTW